MDYEDSRQRRLMQLLASIDFAGRYYNACERFAYTYLPALATRDQVAAALSRTGLTFSYSSREGFFRHRERAEGYKALDLHVSVRDSSVELMLYLRIEKDQPVIGGTFHGLALGCSRIHEPLYARDPLYPRPGFSSLAELEEVLQVCMELFRDARRLIDGEAWR